MANEPTGIDRDKLRAAIRKLANEYVFFMLDDAIELLTPAQLAEIASSYLDLEPLRLDGDQPSNLLADVTAFERASLAGDYYEDFNVNSRNFREQSTGTTAWIAEHRRLVARCVAAERPDDPAEVRAAIDILFGLLDHIDECLDDVVFFADEGGAWQVGVDWAKVLPVWFRVLSATAVPEEYAQKITMLLGHHLNHGRDEMLAIATESATPEQKEALAAIASRDGRRRR